MKLKSRKQNLKRKKLKTEGGITLIALVITIIVILILAGVAIITLTGENGVINRTISAKEKTEDEEVQEIIALAYTAALTDNYVENGTFEESFTKELKNTYGTENVTIRAKGEGIYVVTITGKGKYEIDANGNVEKSVATKTIDDLVAGERVYYTYEEGKEPIECIVLYDSKYNIDNGTNYGVQIITADAVIDPDTGKTKLITIGSSNSLSDATNSYNGALENLYNIVQRYLNEEIATSVRNVGSLPSQGDSDREIGNFVMFTKYQNTFKLGDNFYLSDLTRMREDLKILETNNSYWLSTRSNYDNTNKLLLYVESVSGGERKTDTIIGLYNDYSSGGEGTSYNGTSYYKLFTPENGIRPVITLKPGVKVKDGDGKEIPYTLSI